MWQRGEIRCRTFVLLCCSHRALVWPSVSNKRRWMLRQAFCICRPITYQEAGLELHRICYMI